MHSCEPLLYHLSNVKCCSTYNEAVTAFRNLYNNFGKRARILTKWQLLRFTKYMRNDSDASEVVKV